ncbi:hypothetical protein BUALT_Bualt02G0100400 [Buddleja alternifolia]|uniref:DDE Tnp4 domain-containing protein n=1 Tax=Buddleja alternifolia TaxID=168488 RepID=A0AAV6Y0D3_9LAMI|nr:hypothetical protein BUALT_Bualt02G0100400 [Buddleja alternifolia]
MILLTPKPVDDDCTNAAWKSFKGCLGALDGMYIDVQTPLLDKPRYSNRKGEISVNVLGVVNREMNFVYILSGWQGSAADGRVLHDAVNRVNGLKIRNGQYYLCDNGYINCPRFLAPYRSVRYHLDEWLAGSRVPQNAKELFNQRHTKARNVIERTWGIMKWRWAVLRSTTFYVLRTEWFWLVRYCTISIVVRWRLTLLRHMSLRIIQLKSTILRVLTLLMSGQCGVITL